MKPEHPLGLFLWLWGIGADPHSKMRGTRSGTAQAKGVSPSHDPIIDNNNFGLVAVLRLIYRRQPSRSRAQRR